MASKVTLGADPAIPIVLKKDWETKRASTPYPICGLIGGTKGKPIIVGEAGGYLEDGTMIELNPSPSNSVAKLENNLLTIQEVIRGLPTMTPYMLFPSIDTVYYRPSFLEGLEQAKHFGCSEDFSAYDRYTPRVNLMQEAFEIFGDHNIRFAGGHIHFGITPWPEDLPRWVAVRLTDVFLGLPILAQFGENKTERARIYGKAGIFRETSYGFEYRTPSPLWLNELNRKAFSTALSRAKAVANLFAEFDLTKDELVTIYNGIDWDAFEDHFYERDYFGAAAIVAGKLGTNNRFIPVAGRLFDLLSPANLYNEGNAQTCKDVLDPQQAHPPIGRAVDDVVPDNVWHAVEPQREFNPEELGQEFNPDALDDLVDELERLDEAAEADMEEEDNGE